MKNKQDEVLQAKATNSKRVKYYPGKYPYSTKLHNYFQLRGVETSTVRKLLAGRGVSENTIKTFLAGSHVPSSYLSHLVEDIWAIRFHHEDFEEKTNG